MVDISITEVEYMIWIVYLIIEWKTCVSCVEDFIDPVWGENGNLASNEN